MNSIYYIIASSIWGIVGIIWIIGIFVNKKTIKRPDAKKYLGTSLLLIISYILIFSDRLPSFLGLRLTPFNGITGLLGDLLCVGGGIFAIWARLALGNNWSGSMATLKKNHTLVRSGPYQIVRHPIYTGLFSLMLGLSLTIGIIGNYIGVIIGLIAFLIRIQIEEKLMISEFPDDYLIYKKTTKGIIPFLF